MQGVNVKGEQQASARTHTCHNNVLGMCACVRTCRMVQAAPVLPTNTGGHTCVHVACGTATVGLMSPQQPQRQPPQDGLSASHLRGG